MFLDVVMFLKTVGSTFVLGAMYGVTATGAAIGGLIAGTFFTGFTLIFAALFMGNPLALEYDEPKERINKLKQQINDALKQDNLPKIVKQKYLLEYKTIVDIIDKTYTSTGLYTLIYQSLFSKARKEVKNIKDIQELDGLFNNDLFAGARSLELIKEDKRGYRQCVRIVIRKENMILLGKKIINGEFVCYEFPGGGIEDNNTIEQTVIKECLEEVGILVHNVRSLDINMSYEIDYPNQERAKLYRGGIDKWQVCEYVKIDISSYNSEGDKLPFEWVTINEAKRLIKSGPSSIYNSTRLEALDKVSNLK